MPQLENLAMCLTACVVRICREAVVHVSLFIEYGVTQVIGRNLKELKLRYYNSSSKTD